MVAVALQPVLDDDEKESPETAGEMCLLVAVE